MPEASPEMANGEPVRLVAFVPILVTVLIAIIFVFYLSPAITCFTSSAKFSKTLGSDDAPGAVRANFTGQADPLAYDKRRRTDWGAELAWANIAVPDWTRMFALA